MHCGVGYVLCIRISYSVWSFIILAKGDLFYCLVYPYDSVDIFLFARDDIKFVWCYSRVSECVTYSAVIVGQQYRGVYMNSACVMSGSHKPIQSVRLDRCKL